MSRLKHFFQKYPQSLIELLLVFVVAVAALVITNATGLVEPFVQSMATYMPLRGGLFVFVLFMAIGSCIYAVRRWREVTATERKYRSLFENAPVGIFRTTPDGKFLMANQQVAAILGFESVDALFAATTDLGAQVYANPAERTALLKQLEKQDVVTNLETQHVRRDGSRIWTLSNVRAVRDASGVLLFLEGHVQDITANKETENLYRNVVDQSLLGIAIFQDGHYVFANRAEAEVFGLTVSELLALTPEETIALVYSEDRAFVASRMRERLAGKHVPMRSGFQVIRKDGLTRWVEVNANLIEYRGAPAILALAVDMTERKHAQDEMQANLLRAGTRQDLNAALGRASPDVQTVVDSAAHVLAGTLGDVCVISIVSADGEWLEPKAYAHAEPARKTFLDALYANARWARTHPFVERVVTGGEPVYIPEFFRASLDTLPLPLAAIAEQYGIAGYIAVPIRNGPRVLGTMELLREQGSASYTMQDQILAQELADRCALSIANAQLVQALQAELATRRAAEQVLQAGLAQTDARQATVLDLAAHAQTEQVFAEALREATALLNRVSDYDQVLDGILEIVARIVPYETACIYLKQGDVLQVMRSRGFEKYGLTDWVRNFILPLDTHNFQVLVQTEKPLIIPDSDAWDGWVAAPETRWARSHITAPIRINKRVEGMISLDTAAANFYRQADEARVAAFAELAAAALSNAELLRQTERRANQLALLYDAGLTLNRVLNSRTQLEFLFRIAQRTLRADRMAFFRYVPQGETLAYELGIGIPQNIEQQLLTHPFSVARGEGLAGWVAQQRLPALVADVFADERWFFIEGEDVKAAVVVPVEHEQNLRGVLMALNREKNAFSAQDERMLILLGNQVAAAMELTHLFEAQARRQYELEILRQANLKFAATFDRAELITQILEYALMLVHADNAHLFLYEQEQLLFGGVKWAQSDRQDPLAPRKGGLTDTAARTGQMIVIDTVNAHPLFTAWQWGGAIVALPMRSGDQVRAVLNLAYEKPHQFEAEELRALQLLVDQAAIALENARNYAETQRQLRDAQLLHRAGQALTRTLSFDEMMEQLADFFMEATGVDACCISRLDVSLDRMVVIVDRDPIPQSRVNVGTPFAISEHAYLQEFVRVPHSLILHRDDPKLDPRIVKEMDSFFWKSVLMIPLLSGQEVIGAIELADQKARREFSPDVVRLAESLAYQAAGAVQNVRVIEQITQRAQELMR